jgi:hypothetical protein
MTNVIKVNTQILKSIPIDSGLKRYLIKWFSRMCECNGPSFAVSKVKGLRELLMKYISDPNRLQKLDEYLQQAPIRKNHRLKQLFSYADTNPIAVLAFLKMYLGEADTLVSVEESQQEMHDLLSTIVDEPGIPQPLKRWLSYLRKDYKELTALYNVILHDSSHPYHYVVKHHDLSLWNKYWSTWKGRLLKASKQAYEATTYENAPGVVPIPSMYADAKIDPSGSVSSAQFESDMMNFLRLFPDSNDGEEVFPLEILDWLIMAEEPDRVFNLFELDDIVSLSYDDVYVGQIHHIPKKGTVRRRPIAVPNRFLQKGMLPFQKFLYKVLRGLPRDHTFDQTKSSSYIKHRVDSGFYTCSVDLSHATDYLPKSVGDYIVDAIIPRDALDDSKVPADGLLLRQVFNHSPQPNEDFVLSRKLFDFMSRASWKNGEYLDSWKIGQPLGTLPSFGMLALEHNILLESLALSCGYIHSPYTVLGDDVLLFSKRMRTAYIKMMQDLGVPLSIHKSYEHNLVEFAGQIVVKNQPVSYTPDPAKVSWYNLFDYSRNSGFLLSYHELPHDIRKGLSRRAQRVSLTGDKFYRLCAELYFAYFGSPYHSYMDYSMGILPFFVEVIESECKLRPDLPELSSGWNVLHYHGRELLAYTGRAYLRKQRTTPEWVRKKFKPMTTNAIIAFTMKAVELSTASNEG